MTPERLKQYLDVMKEYGVHRFQLKGMNIEVSQELPIFSPPTDPFQKVQELTVQEKEKLEKMRSLSTMKDEELINELFPEPKPDVEV